MQDFMTDINQAKSDMEHADMMNDVLVDTMNNIDTISDDELDIANAKLEDVKKQEAKMTGNIATLVTSLDNVTSAFGEQFKTMKEDTMSESIIGFFSSSKAQEMRQDRINEANIDDNLNNLIHQSHEINKILIHHRDVLDEQLETVSSNLSNSLSERENVLTVIEDSKVKRMEMEPVLVELEQKIMEESDAKTRSAFESELQALNEEFNRYVSIEETNVAKSQTLEKFITMGQSSVDSLQDQITAQKVLISKIETDTEQRVVLYDALVKSLKTAEQQETAHLINEIGTKVDHEAQATMAHIGASTKSKIADMMEAHTSNMNNSQEIQRKKEIADKAFMRRFGDIVDKHDSGVYGE